MVCPQASADWIRNNISSSSTWTPATATLLSELLLPKSKVPKTSSNAIIGNPTKRPSAVKLKSKAATSVKSQATRGGIQRNGHEQEEQLSHKERSILATEVINATLKALSEAIKSPTREVARKQTSSTDIVKTSARRTLRRSNSLPQSPLQPRSLNRVSSSPNISSVHSTSSSSHYIASSAHRSIAECTRIAFNCLRAAKSSKILAIDLSPMHLESGMSALIGKLLLLGLDDLAGKELRLLKRQLSAVDDSKEGTATRTSALSTGQPLSELLDFGCGTFTGPKLALVITTQLQTLRLMASSRKCCQIEATLPILHPEHPSSPQKFLMLSLKEAKEEKQREKVVRQFQTLGEVLLSLCPSLSASGDALASEPKLSISPEVAIQIQIIALYSRVFWWNIAGHQGDTSKDLFEPLLRCLSTFARRSTCGSLETYQISSTALKDIQSILLELQHTQAKGPQLSVLAVYKLLGSLAKEAGVIGEAISWIEKVYANLSPKTDSEAEQCAVLARLTSLYLRRPVRDPKEEELLLSLLESLERPFKGESSQIDDLLTEVGSLRRSANALLAKGRASGDMLSDGLRDMCESLIFSCPRLSLRYLGTSPDVTAPTKEIIRHDQRRKFIRLSALHSIDSVLLLVKVMSTEARLTWDLIDIKLQDCLLLHNRLDVDSGAILTEGDTIPPAYYVRISNLYYGQFLNMRRAPDEHKDTQLIRVLRRAIDCMKDRPQHEKKAAFLWTKLERMAQLYKQANRYDELYQTLLSLRDVLVNQGVLTTIAEFVSHRPISSAWVLNDETSVLGRTIQSLIKVHLKYLKSSGPVSLFDRVWPEDHRAIVLEHQLEMLSNQPNDDASACELQAEIFRNLLSLYGIKDYPIRRLRVLLKLCSLDESQRLKIVGDLNQELRPYLLGEILVEDTSDEGLRGFAMHFKTMAITSMELQQEQPLIDVLTTAVVKWISMVQNCNDVAMLRCQVDDIDALLFHLQSMSDYMQVKGQGKIRLTVLRLIADLHQLLDDSTNGDAIVSSYTNLASQWLQLGYSGKAGIAFDKAKDYSHRNGIRWTTSVHLCLSYSEYLLTIGDREQSEEQLNRAQALYLNECKSPQRVAPALEERIRKNLLVSSAYIRYSQLAFERGSAHVALCHAKHGIKLLRGAWTSMEEKFRPKGSTPNINLVEEAKELPGDVSQMSLKAVSLPVNSGKPISATGSDFWPLITPLFQSLNYIATLYAHYGMFQETLYYTQEAHKLAVEIQSDAYLALASALLGNIWVRAGVLDRGSEFLTMAKRYIIHNEKSRQTAVLDYYLGILQGMLGDHDMEVAAYKEAENTLQTLADSSYIKNADRIVDPSELIEEKMAQLDISKPKGRATRRHPARPKVVSVRKTIARPTSPIEVLSTSSLAEDNSQLAGFGAYILRQRARALVSTNNFVDALSLLREADKYAINPLEKVDQATAMAKYLLLHSLEQMAADPFYSVLQDSTISFPSVAGPNRTEKIGERLSVVKSSPPAKCLKTDRGGTRSSSPASNSYFNKLQQAQEHLTETQSIAIAFAPLNTIQNIAALLNSVAILLSASAQTKGRLLANPGWASCSVEIARTLALRRQRKVHAIDSSKVDINCWPAQVASESRRSSVSIQNDMPHFQQNYIDIIPVSWTAISIALSDSRNELSITKFEAGHNPFILRLPLGRHNSMDADEEVFGFEQGHAELLEIIQLANESAHDARDMTSKDAKTAWWEERETLDARLRDLLENIEKVWLGGFTGVFSQHARRPELLARFQKSFQNILDKYLPSRRKSGKRRIAQHVALDVRILELFIGLGDASSADSDFSEPLTDLLYFVVDVLQFHGEVNAYAEIDFDSIVVEMHDALRGYHATANACNDADEGRHTILILDKALHAFPWESLPCMEGSAVSRLPSLGSLRDRIMRQQTNVSDDVPEGHYVDREKGSYILNPGGDLKNTQATFQTSLQGLKEWQGIVKREPKEDEIKTSLESKDLYLYFGHGSGAQYIRAREIRKLDKCAVTWLMGCSSGALNDVAEFEPYGPSMDYMHAGCPALVATLWDVTDKDIDRFAKTTFEHWGLFEKDISGKGKGRAKRQEEMAVKRRGMSLVEAVAKGRAACYLKYLNAAAVCVYGIPVYFK